MRIGLIISCGMLLAACLPEQLIGWWSDAEEKQEERTRLTVAQWEHGARADEVTRALLDEFNQGQEEVEAVLTLVPNYERALLPLLQGDDGPDLFLLDLFSLPTLVENDLLEPLTDGSGNLFSRSLETDLYPQLIEMFSTDGILYCLPREFTTLALVYHQGLFDAAGLAYPDARWTWEDLQAAAEQITDSRNDFYSTFGFALTPDVSRWLPFLYQAGGNLFTADQRRMALDTLPAQTAMNFYLDLYLNGYAIEPKEIKSTWAGEALGKERVGMIIEGSWITTYLAGEFPSVEYGTAPLPRGMAAQTTVLFGNCYGLLRSGGNKMHALQLLQHLTSIDAMSRWREESALLPARMSLQEKVQSAEPKLAAFYAGIENAVPWKLPVEFDSFVDAVNHSMQQVINAEVTSDEVLRVGNVIGNDLLQRHER